MRDDKMEVAMYGHDIHPDGYSPESKAKPSPGGQDALASELLAHAEGLERMAADDRETGLSIEQAIEDGEGYTPDEAADIAAGLQHDAERGEETAALLRNAAIALAARKPVGVAVGYATFRDGRFGSWLFQTRAMAESHDSTAVAGGPANSEIVPLFRAPAQAVDLWQMPEGWRLSKKATCYQLSHGNDIIGNLVGPDAEENAAIIARVLDSQAVGNG